MLARGMPLLPAAATSSRTDAAGTARCSLPSGLAGHNSVPRSVHALAWQPCPLLTSVPIASPAFYLDAITGLQDIEDEDEAAPIVESTVGQIMTSGVDVTLSSVRGVAIDITAPVGGPLMLIQSLLTALAAAREVDQETLIFELREELDKHGQGGC